MLIFQSWNLLHSKDIKGLYHSVEEWHLVVNFTFTARDQENIEMHIIKITFSPSEPPSRDWVTRSAQNTDTYTKSQQPCSLHFFTHYQFSHYSTQFQGFWPPFSPGPGNKIEFCPLKTLVYFVLIHSSKWLCIENSFRFFYVILT